MACLVCGHAKTIDAHLIPRAFALEVQASPGERHLLVHHGAKGYKKTNTGLYDPNILCGNCDGVLGKHEGYVYELLKKVRAQHSLAGKILSVDPVEGDKVVRFGAGIAWKYAATRRELGRIALGPYQDVLAAVAFELGSIPPEIDLTAFQLQAGDDEVYFYRAPFLDRKEGVNIVRFSVGGFVFFLKVDRRRNPSFPPPECWFRGKSVGCFPIAPAHSFEEWNLHAETYSASGANAFFQEMLHRKAARSRGG